MPSSNTRLILVYWWHVSVGLYAFHETVCKIYCHRVLWQEIKSHNTVYYIDFPVQYTCNPYMPIQGIKCALEKWILCRLKALKSPIMCRTNESVDDKVSSKWLVHQSLLPESVGLSPWPPSPPCNTPSDTWAWRTHTQDSERTTCH